MVRHVLSVRQVSFNGETCFHLSFEIHGTNSDLIFCISCWNISWNTVTGCMSIVCFHWWYQNVYYVCIMCIMSYNTAENNLIVPAVYFYLLYNVDLSLSILWGKKKWWIRGAVFKDCIWLLDASSETQNILRTPEPLQ